MIINLGCVFGQAMKHEVGIKLAFAIIKTIRFIPALKFENRKTLQKK